MMSMYLIKVCYNVEVLSSFHLLLSLCFFVTIFYAPCVLECDDKLFVGMRAVVTLIKGTTSIHLHGKNFIRPPSDHKDTSMLRQIRQYICWDCS